jgi:SAM-dependent methyltransferase
MTKLWAPEIYAPTGFNRGLALGVMRALDVGCGGRKLPGAVGMDRLTLPGVDIVHDFETIPWPIKDSSFDLVFLNHSLEHADDVVAIMQEIHRVLVKGGHVVIQVPYFRSVDAYGDPTHKHFFTSDTLDYFIEGSALFKYAYSNRRFVKKGFWYGWPHPSRNPLKRLIKSLVTARPTWYDQYLSLLFPTECLTWELETF